jgi:putative flippase GtrA
MLNTKKEIRFIFVGTSAFLIQLLLTWYFLGFGVRAAIAVAVAFIVAFTFAYLMHKYWTFSSDVSHYRALPKYFFAQMLALACGVLSAEFFLNFLGFSNSLTAIAATFCSAAISFYLSSRWVF